MKMKVELVTVRLGGAQILREVDLDFEAGSKTAIIGPNGAGKSTLLRALAGLVEPVEGRVLVDGSSVQAMTRRELARSIAYLGQSRISTFDYTVLEFVMMGLHARLPRFSLESESDRDRAHAALDRVELGGMASRGVHTLSGGEYQRCAIARMIMAQAPVWLLDEPTSDLDPRHARLLLELTSAEADEDDRCVVAVLHDLHLAARYFDRVVVLCRGEVEAVGAVDAVMEPEVLSRVYEVSIERLESRHGPVFVTSDR